MTAIEIKQALEQALPDCNVQVNSPDNVHFEAVVISDLFLGKTRVQQQQMVYQILNPYISSGQIHALALKTATLAEWNKANG